MKKILAILLCLSMPALAALPNTTVFEVEGGGSDTNGGGFVTGSGGTDWSQQNAAHVTFNGTSVSATAAGVTSTIVISGYTVATTDVGNLVQITSGTGFTPGIYEIVSVNVGSVTWTLDRNCTTGVASAMVGAMGGAFATPQQGISSLTADQSLYIASATYTISSVLTLPSVSPSKYSTRVIGYGTVRGDEGMPVISVTGAINGINANQQGWSYENLQILGHGMAIGINTTVPYNNLYNVKISSFNTDGIFINAIPVFVFKAEVTGGSGSAGAIAVNNDAQYIVDSNIHDNTTGGIISSNIGPAVINCVITNNTGATSDGISSNYQMRAYGNTIYGNGRDGIHLSTNLAMGISGMIFDNIIAKNGGYGINWTSLPPTTKWSWANYNGYWNNTTAAVNGITNGANDVVISGTGTTNDPFVSDSTGNFALNNTAGAGALLRATGFPGVLPGSLTTGYRDIGAFQHQDSGGGATTHGYTFSN